MSVKFRELYVGQVIKCKSHVGLVVYLDDPPEISAYTTTFDSCICALSVENEASKSSIKSWENTFILVVVSTAYAVTPPHGSDGYVEFLVSHALSESDTYKSSFTPRVLGKIVKIPWRDFDEQHFCEF